MWLLIGDLHLTDQAKDAYRFGIFDWIKQQQINRPVAATFLAGDLTDAKDRHSATLVNKVVDGLLKLKPPIYICMGNHDYRDRDNPFFKFLDHIEGIHYVSAPDLITANKRMGIIPHYRHQDDFNRAALAYSSADAFLVHQTFDGAIAESGIRLSGLSASPIELIKPPLGVYAGDVHKPQRSGIVTYIGCPYHVRFGDNFEPSCIYIYKDGTKIYPQFEAPRKWALKVRSPEDILNNVQLIKDDQVKLTIELAREEAVEWKKIKVDTLTACKEVGLHVYGAKLEIKTSERRKHIEVKPGSSLERTMEQFCVTEYLSSQTRDVGINILEKLKNET